MTFEFFDHPTMVDSPSGPILVRPFQIVIPVRIGDSPTFPAILDTGHNHHFSISEKQLADWTGESLEPIGHIKLGEQVVPLCQAELWVGAISLNIPEGIAVFPSGPRLPLLGLRALAKSQLHVAIDGRRLSVTIKELD